VEAQLPVQGSPRQLMVDRDALYVRVWRRDRRERVDESLLAVDPATVAALAEVRINPAGAGGAVRDGLFWSPDADPYAHEDPSARCFDARTGELVTSMDVPGWLTAVAAGPDGVWGSLERRGEPGGAVVELTPDGSARTIDLSGLDVAAHLPTIQPT
jgi:hypothetical protein